MVDAYYEGKSAQQLIWDTRRWLGVNATDPTRYSDADVIESLNMGQERFAKLTACLPIPVVVVLEANRQDYRLPYNCTRVISGRYFYSNTPTEYDELKIVHSAKKLQRMDSRMRGTTGTPRYLFPSYRAGNVLTFGLAPIPYQNGTSWYADDYGVMVSGNGYTSVGNITGTHKAGFPSSAELVDAAGRNFVTLGARVGYPIYNQTDESSGLIEAIGDQDATNDKITTTLAGGTANAWNEGDAFLMPMGEYGIVVSTSGTETFTSYLGTVQDIAGNTGNLVLDVARRPIALSVNALEWISEIPPSYQDAVVAYAVYILGRGAFKGVTQKEKAVEGLTMFNQYVQEYLLPDEMVEETDPQIEDRSYEWLL